MSANVELCPRPINQAECNSAAWCVLTDNCGCNHRFRTHQVRDAATIDMAMHEAAELVEVMARAGEEIKGLRAENATLRAFARDIMAAWPDGDVDGGALQEIAVAHGLLVPETRTEPCGDACECAEYHSPEDMAEGVTCYRRGPLLSSGAGT